VANQDSGTVVVFKIDLNSGRLSPTGQVLKVPSPVCLKFAPAD
jgi:6-phosphogluconolactonase